MTSRSVICYIGFLFVIWQYGEANVVEEYNNGLLTMIFQPRPFILSWYLFIMTIDTSPLCLYKVSESTYINILLNIFILCEGYCTCTFPL